MCADCTNSVVTTFSMNAACIISSLSTVIHQNANTKTLANTNFKVDSMTHSQN